MTRKTNYLNDMLEFPKEKYCQKLLYQEEKYKEKKLTIIKQCKVERKNKK